MTEFDRKTMARPTPEQAGASTWTDVGARLGNLSRKYAMAFDAKGILGGAAYATHDIARKIRNRIPGLAHPSEAASRVLSDLALPAKAGIPLLGFRASGGIGDYVVMARYLRDLASAVGPFEYDIYANNAATAAWIFSTVPDLSRIRSDQDFSRAAGAYPVAAVIGQMLDVRHVRDGRRGPGRKMAATLSASIDAVNEYRAMLEAHPFLDGDFADLAVARGWSRRTLLQTTAGIPYGGDLLDLPLDPECGSKFGLAPKGYITVHNGYDASFPVAADVATKCYPHFSSVIARIKSAFPGMTVVHLGTSTSRPIEGVDVDLVSRTNLREAAAVVAGSALHIDKEGGLVHIAACYGVRSAVVFGPTNAGYFGYPENINLTPTFCGNCWWATPDWMERCPAGYGRPRCMTERDPAAVASEIMSAAAHELEAATNNQRRPQ